MDNTQRILITPGEPAGIGPDILIQIAQQKWNAELIAVCDPDLLIRRATLLNLPFRPIPFDINQFTAHQPGSLTIIPVKMKVPAIPGKLNPANVSYVLDCLDIATDYALTHGMPLATGPIQKSIIQEHDPHFMGHTEFLAKKCHAEQALMLFVAKTLKVALATTHIPLAKVPQAITTASLIKTIRLLHSELQKKFALKNPTLLVSGLNPHAGEHGHLGHEEQEIIEPAIKLLQNENIKVIGPLPADTIFTGKYLKNCDAILVMYHDQGLPVVKYLGFGEAVNVTLGLPIIRTSVDHGTALDIAGTLHADASSLVSAINLALELVTMHEK